MCRLGLLLVVFFLGAALCQFPLGTPAPTSCAQLSGSCARCHASSLGCRYYWGLPGFYNSSTNGTCTTNADFTARLQNNLRRKTIFAWALPEDLVNTTRGQYILKQGVLSSLAYSAVPVLCFDRHLCYCKPMPPPPPNNVTVVVFDLDTGKPICGSSTSLTGKTPVGSGLAQCTDPNLASRFYGKVPINDVYTAFASATGYTSNSSVPTALGQGQSVIIPVYLRQIPCLLTVVVYETGTTNPINGATVTITSIPQPTPPRSLITGANGIAFFGEFRSNVIQVTGGSASAPTYAPSGDQVFDCPLAQNVTRIIYLDPLPSEVRVFVAHNSTGTLVYLEGVTVNLSGPRAYGPQFTRNEFGMISTLFRPVVGGTYTATATNVPNFGSGSATATRALNPRADSLNITIILVENPCVLNVRVIDSLTNLTLVGSPVVLDSTPSRAPVNTGNDGIAPFGTLVTSVFTVRGASASFPGYISNSRAFTCPSGTSQLITIPLDPIPSEIRVFVATNSTGSLVYLSGAVVLLNGPSTGGPQPTTVNNAGIATPSAFFRPIYIGGLYSASATLTGYGPGSATAERTLKDRADSLNITIILGENPCILNIRVLEQGTNATLSGALVTVTTSPPGFLPSRTTDNNGFVGYGSLLPTIVSTSGASASLSGYNPGSAAFQCPGGSTQNIIIFLVPIPSQLRICVATNTSGSLVFLPGATVNANGPTNYGPSTTLADGCFLYNPANGGSYTAFASLTGYTSGSQVGSRPLAQRNDSLTITVILVELPCALVVQVLSNVTGLPPISGATVLIPGLSFNRTTNSTGWVSLVSNTYGSNYQISASAAKHNDGTGQFTCNRGGNTTVIIILTPVNEFILNSVDFISRQRIQFVSYLFTTFTTNGVADTVANWCNARAINSKDGPALTDSTTATFPDISLEGGKCRVYNFGLSLVFKTTAQSLEVRLEDQDSPAYQKIRDSQRAAFNITFPIKELPLTSLPYNLLITPFEVLDSSDAYAYPPLNLYPNYANKSSEDWVFTEDYGIAHIKNTFSYPLNPTASSSQSKDSANVAPAVSDKESDDLLDTKWSFPNPDNFQRAGSNQQVFTWQSLIFREVGIENVLLVLRQPTIYYRFNFVAGQTTKIPAVTDGTDCYNISLPPRINYPWRTMPIFIPFVKAHLWILLKVLPYQSDTVQLATFPKGSNIGVKMNKELAGRVSAGRSALLFPFLYAFSSTSQIEEPSVTITGTAYFPHRAGSGYVTAGIITNLGFRFTGRSPNEDLLTTSGLPALTQATTTAQQNKDLTWPNKFNAFSDPPQSPFPKVRSALARISSSSDTIVVEYGLKLDPNGKK